MKPLELWGGVECTIARIGDEWRDELADTGHYGRPGDLEAVADLGFKTLRYPILWESVSPRDPGEVDFRWHDASLRRLRDVGIAPIAGLVHHGSGPRYTDLLDPQFPHLLARHALRVAKRFPWIEQFTPVNEPLTTARFSALYGHWYPHQRDMRSFARALINQCRGVLLSMRAIRSIIPAALLVQTEDLGRVFGTPALQYQADYENERRWLTFDLLLGRVDRFHPWFDIFLSHGIEEAELLSFCDTPCPPDIIGINHYPTSDRYLDHTIVERAAHLATSGNGHHRYVDLEAVRMRLPPGSTGPEARLREAWARYERPIAVTEVHHGCSREEQLRWLHEVWTAASGLRAEGADIRAVTMWALFGAQDWSSLLTRRCGAYESGAFHVLGPKPRLTALGKAAREVLAKGGFDHPVLDTPGWWHRNDRFYRPTVPAVERNCAVGRVLMIAGAKGSLRRALTRIAVHRGLQYVALDFAGRETAERAMLSCQPWAVVNADSLETPSEYAGHCERGVVLAGVCALHKLPLVTFSSGRVFSGWQNSPHVESDTLSPPGPFEARIAQSEREIQSAHPGGLIVRTSALFGPWDEDNEVVTLLRNVAAGASVSLSAGKIVSPTYMPDLVHAALDLLIDGETGIWHLANGGKTSWHDFGCRLVEAAGLDTRYVSQGPPHLAKCRRLRAKEAGRCRPWKVPWAGFFAIVRPIGGPCRYLRPNDATIECFHCTFERLPPALANRRAFPPCT